MEIPSQNLGPLSPPVGTTAPESFTSHTLLTEMVLLKELVLSKEWLLLKELFLLKELIFSMIRDCDISLVFCWYFEGYESVQSVKGTGS